jgi:hypothetical protein
MKRRMSDIEYMLWFTAGMAVCYALAWWGYKRWPPVSPPPWDASLDEPEDDDADLYTIRYPLDDRPWPVKDGVERP